VAIFGYARVSTARQANEGESLDVQRRQIEGYALMHGWTIAPDAFFVEEGVSGSVPFGERQRGAELLARLQPGDVLIAAKLDRLFRSALDALQATEALKARGVKLHLIDLGGDIAGNGLSKLFLTIAAAFAEAERDRIRERVATVKADQRARRRFLGGAAPFGYSVAEDGALVPEPEEQAFIDLARTMAADGASLRTIATAVNANRPPRPVSHVTIGRVLKRNGEP
jgi:putative DNA-invertase from lambdoid prophage Rac